MDLSEDSEPEPKPFSLLSEAARQFSTIAIVRTDVIRSDFPTHEAYLAEKECILRSQQVAEILSQMGVKTEVVVADTNVVNNLIKLKPELCINFVDTLHGSGALASSIPGIFELLHIPYVGANTLSLALNNNKYLTKTLLEAWDLPTTQSQLFRSPHQSLSYYLRFPLILKLNEEHGSVGIGPDSVVTNEKELKAKLQYLIQTYHQPVLAEEFIEDGIEITGVVLEAKQTIKVLLGQRSYETQDQFRLLTFETKWATDLGMEEPVEYLPFVSSAPEVIRDIKDDLRKAFEVLKMDDLARFDLIIDKYHNHYIIDSNANPSLGPESGVARTAQVNGIKFTTILLNILQRNRRDLLKA